jgi:hypothetical protein
MTMSFFTALWECHQFLHRFSLYSRHLAKKCRSNVDLAEGGWLFSKEDNEALQYVKMRDETNLLPWAV